MKKVHPVEEYRVGEIQYKCHFDRMNSPYGE